MSVKEKRFHIAVKAPTTDRCQISHPGSTQMAANLYPSGCSVRLKTEHLPNSMSEISFLRCCSDNRVEKAGCRVSPRK